MTTETLIEAAQTMAITPRLVTRCDGTTYMGAPGYGFAHDGDFSVDVVEVQQRTRIMRSHFRATFSVKRDGSWKRVSRVEFEKARGDAR